MQFVRKRDDWPTNIVHGREVVTLLDVIFTEIQNGCICRKATRLKRFLLKYYLVCPNEETERRHLWQIVSHSHQKWKTVMIDRLVTWWSMCWSFQLHTIMIIIKSRTVMTRSKDKKTEKSILSNSLCQVLYCVNYCLSLTQTFVDADMYITNSAIVQFMESFGELVWIWSETSSSLWILFLDLI